LGRQYEKSNRLVNNPCCRTGISMRGWARPEGNGFA
jgi:hypothetical protein